MTPSKSKMTPTRVGHSATVALSITTGSTGTILMHALA